MNNNISSLKQQFQKVLQRQIEIRSGTVVAGSYDSSLNTISVTLDESALSVPGVKLNAVAENVQGFYLVPEDNSHVVVGTIDGEGEWVLLRTSTLRKAIVQIGNVQCEIDGSSIKLKNNSDSFLEIDDGHIKLNTGTESLYTWLKDVLLKISAITVPTGTGTSGVPLNAPDFNTLISRLGNLLSS